jgi:AhpD family alkylhydroperoxidase
MSRMLLQVTAPEPYAGLVEADLAVRKGPLDATLQELVKIRASQLNGCEFCVDKHTKGARALGATEDRISQLSDWSTSLLYSESERAALAYTEVVTRLDDVPDELWGTLTNRFTDDQLGHLVVLVALINAFNRFGVPLRMRPLARAS